MIIVSQDRKKISENLEIEIRLLKSRTYEIRNVYMKLGEYKTEERAKEVLQEIVEVFKNEDFFNIRKSSLNNLDELAEPKYILKSVSRPKVYEMPER